MESQAPHSLKFGLLEEGLQKSWMILKCPIKASICSRSWAMSLLVGVRGSHKHGWGVMQKAWELSAVAGAHENQHLMDKSYQITFVETPEQKAKEDGGDFSRDRMRKLCIWLIQWEANLDWSLLWRADGAFIASWCKHWCWHWASLQRQSSEFSFESHEQVEEKKKRPNYKTRSLKKCNVSFPWLQWQPWDKDFASHMCP